MYVVFWLWDHHLFFGLDDRYNCHSEGFEPQVDSCLWHWFASRWSTRERQEDCGRAVCQLQDSGTSTRHHCWFYRSCANVKIFTVKKHHFKRTNVYNNFDNCCFTCSIQHRIESTVVLYQSTSLSFNSPFKVLIATSTLAWGVNFPAHLVIVKGTEYFDGKTHRYVDYPITGNNCSGMCMLVLLLTHRCTGPPVCHCFCRCSTDDGEGR